MVDVATKLDAVLTVHGVLIETTLCVLLRYLREEERVAFLTALYEFKEFLIEGGTAEERAEVAALAGQMLHQMVDRLAALPRQRLDG